MAGRCREWEFSLSGIRGGFLDHLLVDVSRETGNLLSATALFVDTGF